MESKSPYFNRPDFFNDIPFNTWKNWRWQQQNAVRNSIGLRKIFPAISKDQFSLALEWERRGFRYQITPYVLSVIQRNKAGNPFKNNPVWRQVFPVKSGVERPDEYSPSRENWEIDEEMISPIAQHKYDNRVIVYVADVCLGYCMYCFRSLQSNATVEKHGGRPYWNQTIEAIRKRPMVEEVILSGGDPLLYDNENIEAMLADIRSIKHVKAIRIHTRAWLHNPYRIDVDFCKLLKKYEVTEIGVHIVHPQEMTRDFVDAVERIRAGGAKTLLMTDTPLIRGINDDPEILHKLFMDLYSCGIKPYYLSHNMPNIPAAAELRTSVRKGLQIYNALKRRISNIAMPEYIIAHQSGKKTVPECDKGTPDFRYVKDQNGYPVIRFKNWKGEWVVYLDAMDWPGK